MQRGIVPLLIVSSCSNRGANLNCFNQKWLKIMFETSDKMLFLNLKEYAEKFGSEEWETLRDTFKMLFCSNFDFCLVIACMGLLPLEREVPASTSSSVYCIGETSKNLE